MPRHLERWVGLDYACFFVDPQARSHDMASALAQAYCQQNTGSAFVVKYYFD